MKRIRIRPLGFLFLLNTALLAALVAPGMTLRQAFLHAPRDGADFPRPCANGPTPRARAAEM